MFREILPTRDPYGECINKKCVLSDDTHVADGVSLSFFGEVVVDAFVASSHHVLTIALVHAVDCFAALGSDWFCVFLSKERVKNITLLLVSFVSPVEVVGSGITIGGQCTDCMSLSAHLSDLGLHLLDLFLFLLVFLLLSFHFFSFFLGWSTKDELRNIVLPEVNEVLFPEVDEIFLPEVDEVVGPPVSEVTN